MPEIPSPRSEKSVPGLFDRTRAWKIKITVDGGKPLDAVAPVALPAGLQCEDDGRGRRITGRWFSLGAVGALAFVAVWDGIGWFVLRAALSSKSLLLSGLLVLSTLAAVGVGMAYAAVAYLVNRTSVRVDAARVSVAHGPLPWFGARSLPTAEISRIWSEKVGHASDEDTLFEPSVTYRVRALLKGGRTLNLVTGLRDAEQAQFIEQEARKFLSR